MVSLNGIEAGYISSRDANRGSSTDHMQKLVESSVQSSGADDTDSQCKHNGSINEVNQAVFVDEISSVDASNKDGGLLENCGILPNNCLPCLASTVPSIEKRRSSISSPPNARKKPPVKLPFKWKEGHGNANLCELKCSNQHSYHCWSSSLMHTMITFCAIFVFLLYTWLNSDWPVISL